nr:DUF6020 family protein [Adlercreutzia sp. ZJ154]
MLISHNIWGTYVYGFVFYTLSQMLVTSAIYSAILLTIKRWGIPRWVFVFSTLFICVFPGFGMWASFPIKDTIFAALFALCIALLFDCFVLHEKPCKKEKMALLWCFVLLMALFRNNAIYGIAIFLVIITLFYKRYRKRIAAIFGSVVLACMVITGPLYNIVGILPASIGEILNVPDAQLALTRNSDIDLSQKDKDFIDFYVPHWRDYYSWNADPVKQGVPVESIKSNYMNYASQYLSIGIEHPILYTEAFLRLSVGYWSPMTDYRLSAFSHMAPYRESQINPPKVDRSSYGHIVINRNSKLPESVTGIVKDIASLKPELSIPILSQIFQVGTWVWLIIFYSTVCIYFKKYSWLIPVILFFCYWTTVMLGPLSWYRYANVAVSCGPIFLGALFVMGKLSISQSGNYQIMGDV